MTREEAIIEIYDAFEIVVHDHCINPSERLSTYEDCRDALLALNVSESEFPIKLKLRLKEK